MGNLYEAIIRTFTFNYAIIFELSEQRVRLGLIKLVWKDFLIMFCIHELANQRLIDNLSFYYFYQQKMQKWYRNALIIKIIKNILFLFGRLGLILFTFFINNFSLIYHQVILYYSLHSYQTSKYFNCKINHIASYLLIYGQLKRHIHLITF